MVLGELLWQDQVLVTDRRNIVWDATICCTSQVGERSHGKDGPKEQWKDDESENGEKKLSWDDNDCN